MILAGIDIGTNSIRLLIAETGPAVFRELYSARRTTRLGNDLDRTGMLSPDAMERSLSVLLDFSAHIRRFSVCRTSAIGTSALRNASNSQEFLEEVHRQTGIEIVVVSGEDEARLTLAGVKSALQGRKVQDADPLASALIIDIGGGSTEFMRTNEDGGPAVQSLPLGAVYLAERCITTDPPAKGELAALRRAIRIELEKVTVQGSSLQHHARHCPEMLIGTAGTITTLAAMNMGMVRYDPARINGSILSREAIDRIVLILVSTSLSRRRTLPGLEHGREDIILPGAIIVQEIMERYSYSEMLVSDWGLREGIITDLSTKGAPTAAT